MFVAPESSPLQSETTYAVYVVENSNPVSIAGFIPVVSEEYSVSFSVHYALSEAEFQAYMPQSQSLS